MAEDFYNDGFEAGRGNAHKLIGHEMPQTDGDRYSYRQGLEKGLRWRDYDREFERDWYDD